MDNEQTKNQVLTEPEKETTKPKHRRRFFMLSLAFLAIVAAIFAYLYAQRPGQGVILESKLETAAGAKKAYEKKKFEGKYVSFEYSSSFEIKTHETSANENQVFLETAFLSEDPSLAKKIALTVENLQGRTLEDSANYHLRKTYPKRFQEEKFNLENVHGTAFTDKDSELFEKTIFIPHENYLAEISLTALRPASNDLDRELNEIVGSLIWRK